MELNIVMFILEKTYAILRQQTLNCFGLTNQFIELFFIQGQNQENNKGNKETQIGKKKT